MTVSSPSRTLAITSSVVFMVSLETTIIALAFPEIVDAFPDTSSRTLSWVLTAYNVGVASMLLPAGYWADVSGRRRVFLIGIALFAAGSLLATAAWSAATLIGARVLQSIGGAIQYPAGLALLLDAYPAERRQAAIGIWAAMGALAAAAGPSLGGLLVDAFGWRSIFAINLPVAIAAVALGRRWLVDNTAPVAAGRVDLISVPLASIGVGTLVLAVVQYEVWGASARLAAVILAGVALVALFVVRSRRHPAPLLDLGLFRLRSYAIGNVGAVAFTAAFFAWLVTLPTYVQDAWGSGIRATGFAMAPAPLLAMVLSIAFGRWANRIGIRRILITSGLFGIAAMVLHGVLTGDEPALVVGVVVPGILVGVCAGAGFSMNVAAIMGDVPAPRFGMAGAARTTIFQLSTAVGFAVGFAIIGDVDAADLLGRMRIVWVVCGALFAAQAVVYWRVFPRDRPRSPAESAHR